jgi:hypothetical protein
MPLVYRTQCDSCDYSKIFSASVTYVLMDDGSEEVCPHPGEAERAERITGRSWSELRKANRIFYRNLLVCLSCGAIDYYGPRDLNVDMPPRGHIRSIVDNPSRGAAKLYTCRSCAKMELRSAADYAGITKSIYKYFGSKRMDLPCPGCRKGIMAIEIFGIS